MVARSSTVILEATEEGEFTVERVKLPVASQGETREEAMENVRMAIEAYLEVKAELLGSTARGERVEAAIETLVAFAAQGG